MKISERRTLLIPMQQKEILPFSNIFFQNILDNAMHYLILCIKFFVKECCKIACRATLDAQRAWKR